MSARKGSVVLAVLLVAGLVLAFCSQACADPPVIGLRVYLIDGDDPDLGPMTAGQCGMVGEPYQLTGYSTYSPSGSLVPDPDQTPAPEFMLYIKNTTSEITAGSFGMSYAFPGALKFQWGYSLPKGDQDLTFRYSTFDSPDDVYGAVEYIVPEPGTLALLACGALGLLLMRRKAA